MENPKEDAWYLEPGPIIPMTQKAYVALGSNMGDRTGNVLLGARALNGIEGVRVIATSRLYETDPVGNPDQPRFINAAAELEVSCNARQLLDGLLEIERRFGRDRSKEQRWGPRTLDLDLLLFRDQRIDEPGLTVPHPRMAQRRFVLEPLCDLAPAVVPPGWNRNIRQALEALTQGAGA
ncbi:MAG: 2-amino-4-hydroxy-6-hydroxymethyldihydropteridine diphosphokinase [Phycisphaeraceae bacterium]|nr:2-amino-4-hydroxy-6-hydroxymethyldihydropteridine diphosphokinase [Phycisphaeraceae bacterium]